MTAMPSVGRDAELARPSPKTSCCGDPVSHNRPPIDHGYYNQCLCLHPVGLAPPATTFVDSVTSRYVYRNLIDTALPASWRPIARFSIRAASCPTHHPPRSARGIHRPIAEQANLFGANRPVCRPPATLFDAPHAGTLVEERSLSWMLGTLAFTNPIIPSVDLAAPPLSCWGLSAGFRNRLSPIRTSRKIDRRNGLLTEIPPIADCLSRTLK